MKKILLLSFILMLLCWGFALAVTPTTTSNAGTITKVDKAEKAEARFNAAPSEEEAKLKEAQQQQKAEADRVLQEKAAEQQELPATVSRPVNQNDRAAQELLNKQNLMLDENQLEQQAEAAKLIEIQRAKEAQDEADRNAESAGLADEQLRTGFLKDRNNPPAPPPVIQDLIMSQSFDADTLRPTDWTDSPGNYRWRFGTGNASGGPGAGNVHSAPNAAFFHIFSYTSGTIDSLISPSMDLSAHSGSYVLRFWHWEPAYTGYDDSATVWLYENGTMTWLYHIPYASDWTMNEIPFSSSSNDAKIYFIGYSDYGYKDPYIDDIEVRDAGDIVLGRCCYGTDPFDPQCADNTFAECTGLGGVWNSLATCADPCPLPLLGDECIAPFVIGSLPYTDTQNTGNFTNNYGHTGNDVIYELTVGVRTIVDIGTCASATNWDTYIYVWGPGQCGSTTYLASADGGCTSPNSSHPFINDLALQPGTYYILVEAYSSSTNNEYTLDVTGTEVPPTIPGELCELPIVVSLDQSTPYTGTNTTCGMYNDYMGSTMGTYDDGEDIIYEVNITEDGCYNFNLDPMGTTYTGIGLFSACPNTSPTAIAYHTSTTAVVHGVTRQNLTAGTYYLMIDSYPYYTVCIPEFTITMEACPPPAPGETCDLPIDITLPAELPYTNDNTTCGMFNDYSTTCLGSYDGGEDIIYRITVTQSGAYNFELNPGTSTWTGIALDDACPFDPTTCIVMHTSSSAVPHGFTNVPLDPGTYYLIIDTYPSPTCIPAFTLSITACSTPPDNDECANAQVIGNVSDLEFSTRCATFDGAGACLTSPNIWYLYTATCDGVAKFSLCGSSYNTKIAVYEGTDCPVTNLPPDPIELQAGEDISTAVAIPSIPIKLTGTTAGYLYDYDPSCGGTGTAPDVVYSYTPTSDINANIELCGTTWDTRMMILDGDGFELACNDDHCSLQSGFDNFAMSAGLTYYIVVGGYSTYSGTYVFTMYTTNYILLGCNDNLCGNQSELDLPVVSGQQYLIEVGGATNSVGDGVLTVQCELPPPNDNCDAVNPADYVLVSEVPVVFTGTNSAASNDCSQGTFADTWFAFTTTDCMNLVINSCGMDSSLTNTVGLRLYDSCPCGAYVTASSYNWTDCGDGNWTLYFDRLPAGSYYYAIYSNPPTGPYSFTVTGVTCPPPLEGESCEFPILADLVPGVPYVNDNTTCGMWDDYNTTCLGYYDEGEDIVYQVNIPQDGCYKFTLDPQGTTYTGIALDYACPPDPTTCIASHTSYSAVMHGFRAEVSAGTYWLIIDTESSPGCIPAFTLTIAECPPPPTNDNCVDATPIGEVTDLAFSTEMATPDGGGGYIYGNNIWYIYTPTCTGLATVSLCGSFYDTKLIVFNGAGCEATDTLAKDDDTCDPGMQSIVNVPVTAGSQYLVEVGGFSTNIGDGILNILCSPPPPADFSVVAPGTFTENNTCGALNDCALRASEEQIWEITIPNDGRWIFSLCGTATSWDSYIYLSTMACANDVAYSDGGCTGSSLSRIIAQITAGTYYLTVEGYSSTGCGAYDLEVTEWFPPAVDFTVIAPGSFTGGNTCGALNDCDLRAYEDQLWQITIPYDGNWTISLCGSPVFWDSYFYLTTAACFGTITSNDDGCGTAYGHGTISRDMLAGIYYLDVEGFGSDDCGEYTVEVQPPPPNACEDPSTVYSNGPATGYAHATQCNNMDVTDTLWQAGVADDFILPGSGNVTIGSVVAYIGFWNHTPVATPENMTGMVVSIYTDNAGSPGGQPVDQDPSCSHVEIIPGGIITSQVIDPANYAYVEFSPGIWQFEIPISEVNLTAGTTYWLEVEPILPEFNTYGQSGWIPTDGVIGYSSMQIFPLVGITTWTAPTTPIDMAFCLRGPAQGRIAGVVYGPDGITPLNAVHVITHDAGQNVVNDTVTTAYGVWNVPLPAGTYHEHLSKAGYVDATTGDIVVTPGITSIINLTMQLAGGCHYTIGDANGSGTYTGLDVTYSVRYFKGGPPPPYSCPCPVTSWYVAGDVNGSCSFTGLDVTYSVRYFKGGAGPIACPTCPPTADILILTPKSNSGSVIGTGSGQ